MKIDLSDVTFVIPVRIDSYDRLNNLNLIILYLNYHFKTRILVGEESKKVTNVLERDEKIKYYHFDFQKDYFYRTKILNELYTRVDTPITVNYDCDVLLDSPNYVLSADTIRNNISQVVYPYAGKFCDVSKENIEYIIKSKSIERVKKQNLFVRNSNSYGGAIFFNTETLLEGGGENENFKSWGWEDLERYHRFKTLGYNITRLEGSLYHLVHIKGKDSSKRNDYYQQNEEEYNKVKSMDKDTLIKYIKEGNLKND